MTRAEAAYSTTTRPPGPYRAARDHEPRAALDGLHAAVADDALVCGPSGHAVASAERVASARRTWQNGEFAEFTAGSGAGPYPLGAPVLAELGIVALRCAPPRPADAGPPADPGPGDGWQLGLLRLRLGLSERLRDAVLTHLRERSFGDTPLLQHQLLRGALADVTIEHLEVHGMLDEARLGPAAVAELHRKLGQADRILLRSFGAAGFLATGPGAYACLSELLGDVYALRTATETGR
ncbi:hypothetical protein [Streptomyces sp. RTGN2]|uniref:hypothetical protein n=1 Tax=Streptomyces sp. RTGN2 TaxID=3016525 RepID=UPI002555006F|nr:hypothetical protein [Streptomyces sp. RTGN2]